MKVGDTVFAAEWLDGRARVEEATIERVSEKTVDIPRGIRAFNYSKRLLRSDVCTTKGGALSKLYSQIEKDIQKHEDAITRVRARLASIDVEIRRASQDARLEGQANSKSG